MHRLCRCGNVSIGPGQPLTIIAGPCLLESLDLALRVGETVRDICKRLEFGYVFKASFDKANRSSIRSPRGPGLDLGLEWLDRIAGELGVPVTTDIHEQGQAEPVAEVVHMLQIPAFLCRQTDLLVAAGEAAVTHNRAVNVKKGQFMSPLQMGGAVRKLAEAGCDNVILTERGTFFGYGALVNDFIGLGDLMELDHGNIGSPGSPPVCFDVTHSTQTPGSGEQTGGRPDRAPLLARAAAAVGVHALFIETHPDPPSAHSDAATQLPLHTIAPLLDSIARINRALA